MSRSVFLCFAAAFTLTGCVLSENTKPVWSKTPQEETASDDSVIAREDLYTPAKEIPPMSEKPVNPAQVQKTPSGLGILELQEGTGPLPTKGQIVSVHYTGRLADGTKFDSSVDRGQPLQFRLGTGQVIKGWDEGISTMKVGGKRRLIIPAHLGYGERGFPGVIPPNAELHFDVELLNAQ